MNNIRWQMFKPNLLPEALFGYVQPEKFGNNYINRVRLDENLIAVGFSDNDRELPYNPPSIIVVGNNNAPEIFSWLKVYAPQTSPLSQFARVISVTDWDEFENSGAYKSFTSHRGDRWASVVLGEVLAQGEVDVELNAIPLSRASACFSTAIARAFIVHGHEYANHTCIDRLMKLEADKRFVRRSVSVENLLPIWSIMGAQIEDIHHIDVIAELVVESARKFDKFGIVATKGLPLPELKQYNTLQSDFIEDRIIAFKKLSSEIMLNFADLPYSTYSSALLAAAAFLVGRGTTHAFMLRPLARRLPTVFAWFGLIAALAGPRTWDTDWSRATKGIERLLRTKFDWSDPPVTDLSWAEYSWLAKTFDGVEVFSELPKMLPKVLSIEVIPGAMCQLRLASGKENGSYEIDYKKEFDAELRNEKLQATLAQFINLALNSRELLEKQGGKTTPTQQTLGLGDSDRSATKAPRAKRSKKGIL